ncbi:MAG: BolA family transcriptional regulator [Legionella longbeachae]|nr:BolA family transcriptional regulator [Legionella longbeachae]
MLRKNRIEGLLNQKLMPVYLSVEDESANHHVPQGAQTHFKVTVVSSQFIDTSQISRHRLLNNLLSKEFELGLHALSMHLFTPEEWEKKNKTVMKSPACRDGFNNEIQ